MPVKHRLFALFVAAATSLITHLSAQSPTFDVVSIKPNTATGIAGLNSSYNQRPDGALIATNIPAGTFIARAFPPVIPRDIVGMPAWAMTERYDVSATSTLTKATPDERVAMLRAMLADRFKLIAHFEKREQPAYDLVLARSDGRLGSGLTPSDLDCVRIQAERAAAAEAALPAGTPPPRPVRRRQDGPSWQLSHDDGVR